jgi:membrane-bound lytic murein transglycosylase MltF
MNKRLSIYHSFLFNLPRPSMPAYCCKKILLLLVLFLAVASKGGANEPDPEKPVEFDDDILFKHAETFKGDLDEMYRRGTIRVLIPYSPFNFYIIDGRAYGFEHDLMDGFEVFLNRGRDKKEMPMEVIFLPIPFEDTLDALETGKGDIVASGLTITKERLKRVEFTEPYIENVAELIISHKDQTDIQSWADMAGKKIVVMSDSSYLEHLKKINERLRTEGAKPVTIVQAEKSLRAEGLVEMVHGKLIEFTVMEKHRAANLLKLLDNVKMQEQLVVNDGGNIGWAVRKDSSLLLEKLNAFIEEQRKKGKLATNHFFQIYFKKAKPIKDSAALTFSPKTKELLPHFKQYSEKYNLPWLLMLAQGFKESSLNPSAKSKAGAIGVMQVLPDTGKDMGFDAISAADNNIHAGIKYMRWIIDNYFKDERLPPSERVYFALASYNAGPNRIKRLRSKAKEYNLDPNVWFRNMEIVVQMHVGLEPVRYVSKIQKYYLYYSSTTKQFMESGERSTGQ